MACCAHIMQGLVSGLPDGFLDDLKWLLRTAYDEHGILVCVSLWR